MIKVAVKSGGKECWSGEKKCSEFPTCWFPQTGVFHLQEVWRARVQRREKSRCGVDARSQAYLIISEEKTWEPGSWASLREATERWREASHGKRGGVIRERQQSGKKIAFGVNPDLPLPVTLGHFLRLSVGYKGCVWSTPSSFRACRFDIPI